MKIQTSILTGMAMGVIALAIWLCTLIVMSNTSAEKLAYMEKITSHGVEILKIIRLDQTQAQEDRSLE